jgi:hypothetical protein
MMEVLNLTGHLLSSAIFVYILPLQEIDFGFIVCDLE